MNNTKNNTWHVAIDGYALARLLDEFGMRHGAFARMAGIHSATLADLFKRSRWAFPFKPLCHPRTRRRIVAALAQVMAERAEWLI
jgi:hypothetical protein